jgi:glycosyltransferase involved in cell wall biosynthesis
MRILMLAQFYHQVVGGEERHVQDLAEQLVTRGHSVAIAKLWHPGQADLEVEGGVRVYRVHGLAQRASWLFKENGRRHAPPFPDPGLLLGLERVIETERPQIVHAHNWLVHSFLPLKKWSGARLVVSLHDYSLVCAKKSLAYSQGLCSGPQPAKCLFCSLQHYGPLKGIPTVVGNWVMSGVERAETDMFIAVSRATAQGNGLVDSALPFEIIPNFVSESDRSEHPDRETLLAKLPKEGFMLFVGDLGQRKGIDVLLRAYAGLTDAPPLVLIGRRLPETPSELPSNVLVLDQWPHSVVKEAWLKSLFGLVPSVWPEPFGIVALEAMAAGRAVIASRIGGLSDVVIDGETGISVPPGDPAALREAIGRLVGDHGLRERLGLAACRRARGFRADAVVPRIEEVYRRLLTDNDTVEATRLSLGNLEIERD